MDAAPANAGTADADFADPADSVDSAAVDPGGSAAVGSAGSATAPAGTRTGTDAEPDPVAGTRTGTDADNDTGSDAATGGAHRSFVVERGSFAIARCSCGWFGPSRRARDRARRDASAHAPG